MVHEGGAACYLLWFILIFAISVVLSGTAKPSFISLPLTPNFQLSRANYIRRLHQACKVSVARTTHSGSRSSLGILLLGLPSHTPVHYKSATTSVLAGAYFSYDSPSLLRVNEHSGSNSPLIFYLGSSSNVSQIKQ